jgi:hypothetical protein
MLSKGFAEANPLDINQLQGHYGSLSESLGASPKVSNCVPGQRTLLQKLFAIHTEVLLAVITSHCCLLKTCVLNGELIYQIIKDQVCKSHLSFA